jgi:hypothetical protein
MALHTAINYLNQPLRYEITIEEENVYIFRLNQQRGSHAKYIQQLEDGAETVLVDEGSSARQDH